MIKQCFKESFIKCLALFVHHAACVVQKWCFAFSKLHIHTLCCYIRLNKGFGRCCISNVVHFWLWACYLRFWHFSFCVSTNTCRRSLSAGVQSSLHGRAVEGAIWIKDWLNCSAVEHGESNHLLRVSTMLECCLQFWVLPFKKLKHSWAVDVKGTRFRDLDSSTSE